MRLKDKTAIVTGGASGIGKAICELFAEEGAQVSIADINITGGQDTLRSIRSNGGEATFIKTDVSVESDVEAMVDSTVRAFGTVNVLVNDAAAFVFGRVEEVTQDDWSRVMGVNVIGPSLTSKHVLPIMKAAGGGSIVNIASVAGKMGNPDRPNYNASKAAAISYTKSSALKLSKFNINVNCICPGNIWTPMWDKISMRQFNFGSEIFSEFSDIKNNRELFQRVTELSTPLKRDQSADDIGYAAAFLLSDAAKNITGQSINVDGGRVMG